MTDCKSLPCNTTKCETITSNNYDCACGPFAITPPFWIAANKPTLNKELKTDAEKFKDCVETFPCSIWAIQYFLGRTTKDCDGDSIINCDDYVLMFNFGANDCFNSSLDFDKLEKYKTCMEKREVVITRGPLHRSTSPKYEPTLHHPTIWHRTTKKPSKSDEESIGSIKPIDQSDEETDGLDVEQFDVSAFESTGAAKYFKEKNRIFQS
ncbi:hypothetical protein HHI36_013904 [Cryptolaemus montrouzieri]|uniref:lysozyme n=1 Tax=Cryptolaemus montrouzieri TaxID=559131 RepID=A0ABD2N1T3_9CUCU